MRIVFTLNKVLLSMSNVFILQKKKNSDEKIVFRFADTIVVKSVKRNNNFMILIDIN